MAEAEQAFAQGRALEARLGPRALGAAASNRPPADTWPPAEADHRSVYNLIRDAAPSLAHAKTLVKWRSFGP